MNTRPISEQQYEWLSSQLDDWLRAELIDEQSVVAIRGRYRIEHSSRRGGGLSRILFSLAGVFVGVGLIWLVAANLEHLSPVVRFAVVTLLWLSALLLGEVQHARHGPPGLTGSIRVVAALGFGAVLFQAAQSLQVPAYEPKLVGLWALGALAQAYLLRGGVLVGPLAVGLGAAAAWWVWRPVASDGSPAYWALCVVVGAVGCLAVAALHRHRTLFSRAWRITGAGLGLIGLFAAALPGFEFDDVRVSAASVAPLAVAAVAIAAGLSAGDRLGRLEVLGALAATAATVALLVWRAPGDLSAIGGMDVAHAAAAVLVYVLSCVGLTAVGVVRRDRVIVALAMLALACFTTFQSFAIFAPIVTGAWLFLVLGVVFGITAYFGDRARRTLTTELDGDSRTPKEPA